MYADMQDFSPQEEMDAFSFIEGWQSGYIGIGISIMTGIFLGLILLFGASHRMDELLRPSACCELQNGDSARLLSW